MQKLITTFLELADIDEMHPHEDQVLAYVERRLRAADVPFVRDKIGNIVGTITGAKSQAVALCAHVDIAAPLNGRKVIVGDTKISTDGSSILGADDKAGVAALLELADELHATGTKPARTLELVLTVGEEAGLVGAVKMQPNLFSAKEMLVFDSFGAVNDVVLRSPAYYKIDVQYRGQNAHPAQWQTGKNAGFALMSAAASLQQGEYAPGVTFNIGVVRVGEARNQVPGLASLQAEVRSFNLQHVQAVAQEIMHHFQSQADNFAVTAQITLDTQCDPYQLPQQSDLFARTQHSLAAHKMQPRVAETYGCFDANVFAAQEVACVILGAGYYNPHSPNEYLDVAEFTQMYAFLRHFIAT